MSRSPDKDRRRRHRLQKRSRRHGHRPDDREVTSLEHDVAAALATGRPLDLLSYVSTMLEVFEDRHRSPSGAAPPPRVEFLAAQIDVDIPETTAVLAAWHGLTAQDLERRLIARTLATRRHRLPAWLSQLDAVRVSRVVVVQEALGDASQYMIELLWPDGTPLTVTALLDANLGHALVDSLAFAAPISDLEQVADQLGEIELTDADPADAHVRVQEAIDHSAIIVPPIETESWPMARPLLEWALRRLPEGGAGYPHVEFDPDAAASIAQDFAAAPEARGLPGAVLPRIVEDLCWFAQFNCGDPLRWSPAKVEQLLCDWWARKTEPDLTVDAVMPTVLAAFVRYCARLKGLHPSRSTSTLQAITAFGPEYDRLIHSPRIDTATMLARLAAGLPPEEPEAWTSATFLGLLAERVGGPETLDALDTHPLPDEEFDWTGIPEDVLPKVAATLELVDRAADDLVDREFRTACRRFLARLASAKPDIFRRPASDATAACAVVHVIADANQLIGRGLTGKAIAQHFGLTGAPSSRIKTFREGVAAAGWVGPSGVLTQVSLLTSAGRRRIIERRDFWRERDDDVPV